MFLFYNDQSGNSSNIIPVAAMTRRTPSIFLIKTPGNRQAIVASIDRNSQSTAVATANPPPCTCKASINHDCIMFHLLIAPFPTCFGLLYLNGTFLIHCLHAFQCVTGQKSLERPKKDVAWAISSKIKTLDPHQMVRPSPRWAQIQKADFPKIKLHHCHAHKINKYPSCIAR